MRGWGWMGGGWGVPFWYNITPQYMRCVVEGGYSWLMSCAYQSRSVCVSVCCVAKISFALHIIRNVDVLWTLPIPVPWLVDNYIKCYMPPDLFFVWYACKMTRGHMVRWQGWHRNATTLPLLTSSGIPVLIGSYVDSLSLSPGIFHLMPLPLSPSYSLWTTHQMKTEYASSADMIGYATWRTPPVHHQI